MGLVACSDPTPDAGPASADVATPLAAGAPIDLGVSRINIKSVVELQQFGNYSLVQASEGAVMVAVDYTVSNTFSDPIDTDRLPTVRLRDPNGHLYAPDDRKSEELQVEYSSYNQQPSTLNPGVTLRTAVIFEVAKAAFDRGRWLIQVGDGGPTERIPASRVAAVVIPSPRTPAQAADTAAKDGSDSGAPSQSAAVEAN